MPWRGLEPTPLATDEQQALVAGVGQGVQRLGQHRARPGEQEGDDFMIAIPVLATNAATIALVPPSTDMRASLFGFELAAEPRDNPSRLEGSPAREGLAHGAGRALRLRPSVV